MPAVEIGDQPSAWWPVAVARDLDPTGIDVVASSSGIGEMVVDGAGTFWVDMPWGVARLDPSSWSAAAWDASDDAAFASKRSLRASTASGVWLIADDQVRLFDGDRFVREIQVPPWVLGEVRRAEEPGGIRDVIEVGAELWIASGAGVSRCDGHAWSVVGENSARDVQELQLTPWGEVWAGSTMPDGQWSWRRSAGTWWVPASWPDHLTADAIGRYPTGWIVALASSETTSGREFMQFDGSAWRKLLRLDDHDVAEPVPVGAVAVSGKGTVWALTGKALLRSTEEKGWHRMDAPDGVSLRGLAVSGDEVVVSTDTGVYRVAGNEFELVWSPQRRWAVVTDITDVVSVSGDQAWIVTPDSASASPPRQHLQRVQVGHTDPVLVTHLPESPELAAWLWGDVADAPAFARGTDPVVASDGAIWY
ncbi:MAG: hypothetical protein MUF09_00430, partial [Candidatus Nanopelagicales bacterium]|nr:hypothetical protein [Candidatus Nanopelagicales bacterium]